MLFSETVFLLLYLPGVLFFYYIACRKNRVLQNGFLTAASLFFYAWGEPFYVLIMIASILFNWFCAWMIARYKKRCILPKLLLVIAVIVNLSNLYIFKYLAFTLENTGMILGKAIEIPEIALPIGISFYTFQAMSYVIDIYRNQGQVQKNPMNVALYISFFPQLIAGPIVRYKTIAGQIKNRKESLDDFAEGFYRFVIGFSKKMILANNLAYIADDAFSAHSLSVTASWLGAIAYTLQIFFDFSAYSDMAIGLGKMFGFHFLENFDFPYVSRSISEFWRRWHISLGTWFRDYVYFPLGGSRVKKTRLVINLLIVWFLTGIWHGANWTFVVWGILYFILIMAEKLTGFEERLTCFGHVYTMFFVIIGWVIFRADNLHSAFLYIGRMFGLGAVSFVDAKTLFYLGENKYFFILAILFSVPIGKLLPAKIRNHGYGKAISSCLLFVSFLISLSYMIKGSYNPFIYFNF